MIMLVMGWAATSAMASPGNGIERAIDPGALVLAPAPVAASTFGDDDAAPIAMRGGRALELCVTVAEHDAAIARCPPGRRIAGIAFASYGTPEGACPRFIVGACHARSSRRVAEDACIGREGCTLPAENEVFGDPCEGTFKRLTLEVVCR